MITSWGGMFLFQEPFIFFLERFWLRRKWRYVKKEKQPLTINQNLPKKPTQQQQKPLKNKTHQGKKKKEKRKKIYPAVISITRTNDKPSQPQS